MPLDRSERAPTAADQLFALLSSQIWQSADQDPIKTPYSPCIPGCTWDDMAGKCVASERPFKPFTLFIDSWPGPPLSPLLSTVAVGDDGNLHLSDYLSNKGRTAAYIRCVLEQPDPTLYSDTRAWLQRDCYSERSLYHFFHLTFTWHAGDEMWRIHMKYAETIAAEEMDDRLVLATPCPGSD